MSSMSSQTIYHRDGRATCATPRTHESVLAEVKKGGKAFFECYDEFKTPEICLAAVKQRWYNIHYVPKEMLTDELFMIAFKQDPFVIECHPTQPENLCIEAVTRKWEVLGNILSENRTPAVIAAALAQDPRALDYSDPHYDGTPPW